ncbi:1,4-dihydroxy-2-naphthoate polyprenyltransferase [Rhizohabitans arisaemae]|uniref:1,4-dihydroxy-2-naphthoate polyprenyltransferase n=1 Tax=Rhizohabitans arisaemae TaxID=2720610 RepID=UPI0024B0DCC9|nr:1,4-dihydroxy-2-naphthoate polyprenyltransferase [Rhizohabitans arisaemae]
MARKPPKLRQWIAGARPRTLPAAVIPVLVGTGVAASHDAASWWRALLALLVSLLLQIGVNYANDYSDGIRGTDTVRVGPIRLVGSGIASPRQVFRAAVTAFGLAAVTGLALILATGTWWMLLVGAASIAAAWFYTGGRRPYGYRALGEISVFVFFGLIAVCGTVYVQMLSLPLLAVVAAIPVGLLACALLVVNNLRDLATDGPAGKRTLAVVLGDGKTRLLYAGCTILPFILALSLSPFRPFVAPTLLVAFLAIKPTTRVLRGATGPILIGVLQQTGRLQLAFGVFFSVGLAFTV